MHLQISVFILIQFNFLRTATTIITILIRVPCIQYSKSWNDLINGFGLAVPLEMLRGRQELQQPGHLENSPQGRNVAPLLKETFSRDLCMQEPTVNIIRILKLCFIKYICYCFRKLVLLLLSTGREWPRHGRYLQYIIHKCS